MTRKKAQRNSITAEMNEYMVKRDQIEAEGRKLWRLTYQHWYNKSEFTSGISKQKASVAYADYIDAFS